MSKKPTVGSNPKKDAEALLETLNSSYRLIHRTYEQLFWRVYMGEHELSDKFAKAQVAREQFRTNETMATAVTDLLPRVKGIVKEKLTHWNIFFSKYQTPTHVKPIFNEIVSLEKDIHTTLSNLTEGYIDPVTKTFTKASRGMMRSMMSTHPDEKIRKACFVALEELAIVVTAQFVQLIALRNQYAQALGFSDFYAYKIQTEEGMSKETLFALFDDIFEQTKFGFDNLREMEKTIPGLRKPWNKAFLLAGDFTTESDQYFPFEEALDRWGRSFSQLGISFHGGTLQLDLLDRAGKYGNGFCHWPELVHFAGKKRFPGQANFTCNVSFGQVGSSEQGYNTLFHEGGHAAHYLNSEETEACINTEYPPASTAWAETQSMFLDTMLSSIEWKDRYAKNAAGESFPFDLYEREIKKLRPLLPLRMNSISSVMYFERAVYEAKNLTEEKLKSIAKKTFTHIYSWEIACSYHGYGLAELALHQWRDYFFKKYGYIVDNKNVGREMRAVWKYAAAKSFSECVVLATGKKLSSASFIKHVTASERSILTTSKKRTRETRAIKQGTTPINFNANIKMVHGKRVVATNEKSFADMTNTYATWLKKQAPKTS
jgi:hypothetical protein